MSVQQVKKQFDVMAGYLGRDAKGLEYLKELKDAVNVLRTSLASTQAKADAAASGHVAAVARATTAELELSAARIECHSLRQRNARLCRELEAARATLCQQESKETDNTAIIEKAGSPNGRGATYAAKRLRERLSYCPQAVGGRGARWTFERDSIATGWSHEALWTLGAAVALLVLFSGEVVIMSDDILKNWGNNDEESHLGLKRLIVQWLRKNLDLVPKSALDKKIQQEIDQEKVDAMQSQHGMRIWG